MSKEKKIRYDTNEIHEMSEMLADKYLDSITMNNDFCGSGLETIVQNQGINLMFKYVKDEKFFGMSAKGKGYQFIGINTFHNKRTRIFDIAHELWHFYGEEELPSGVQYNKEENERAADHFAATLLMPRRKVKAIYDEYKQNKWNELDILFVIADYSSCPYEAVYKRFKELKLSSKQIDNLLKSKELRTDLVPSENETENKFIHLRALSNVSPTNALDFPENLNTFPALNKVLAEINDE